MKKYLIAASIMLSVSVFAQKSELKALRKMSKKGLPAPDDLAEFDSKLRALEANLGSADEEQRAGYYFYKGEYGLAKMKASPATAEQLLKPTIESLEKAIQIEKGTGDNEYTEQIKEQIYPVLKGTLVNQAIELGKQQNYKSAYPLFEQVYRISPRDTVHLYNAAAYASNSQDYKKAIDYYKELQRLGFTGKGVNYTAKNVETGQVEFFPNKTTRDLSVAQKTHVEPGIHREPSKKSDIVKNVAKLYLILGDKENAKKAIEDAKKADPNDVEILSAEAQLYLEADDYDNYKKTVEQILNQGSKDPILYFNLGVTSAKSGDIEGAKKYYAKAIELDPKLVGAYQNLGILQLNGEDAIVNEMNSLGTSKAEMKRYDELKEKRNEMYREAMKYLEKAHEIDPDNPDIKNILGTLYQGLEMMDKYKALKAE